IDSLIYRVIHFRSNGRTRIWEKVLRSAAFQLEYGVVYVLAEFFGMHPRVPAKVGPRSAFSIELAPGYVLSPQHYLNIDIVFRTRKHPCQLTKWCTNISLRH